MKFSTTIQTSVRKVSAQAKTSHLSTHQAITLLKLYSYKVSVVQELKPSDCPKRVEFRQRLLTNYAHNKAVFDNFFFSDIACFILNGCEYRTIELGWQKIHTLALIQVYTFSSLHSTKDNK